MTLLNEIKNFAIDQLNEHKGSDVQTYGADLVYEIAQSINMNGTVEYSTYKTKEKVCKYWNEYGAIYEHLQNELGSDLGVNPFNEIEKLDVITYIEVIIIILGQIKTIEKRWDDEFILTDDIIDRITRELEELEVETVYELLGN